MRMSPGFFNRRGAEPQRQSQSSMPRAGPVVEKTGKPLGARPVQRSVWRAKRAQPRRSHHVESATCGGFPERRGMEACLTQVGLHAVYARLERRKQRHGWAIATRRYVKIAASTIRKGFAASACECLCILCAPTPDCHKLRPMQKAIISLGLPRRSLCVSVSSQRRTLSV